MFSVSAFDWRSIITVMLMIEGCDRYLEEHRPVRILRIMCWTVFLLENQCEARVISRSKNTRQNSWRVFSIS